MSDNVSQFDGSQKTGLWKRILLLILILLLIAACVAAYVFRDRLNLESLRRTVRYLNVKGDSGAGQFSFDENKTNQYVAFGDGLAVVSTTGVAAYTEKGQEFSLTQMPLVSPAVRTGEKTVLAFDAGGNRLIAVSTKSGPVLDLTTEKPILDADVSDDGCVCYAGSEPGYKSVLYVYNEDQALVYRWLSSSQFMPICAVSEKAQRLAAVTLGQKDGMFESSVTVFATSGEEAEAVWPVSNDMLFDLSFTGEDTLCAVGENAAYWFGGSGELKKYDYADCYLKDYDLTGSGFLALILNMYKAGNRCTVVTVDETGEELGSAEVTQQILGFSAAGEYVAVLTTDMLTIYDKTMSVFARKENASGATDVVMRADGTAILLAEDRGELYIP